MNAYDTIIKINIQYMESKQKFDNWLVTDLNSSKQLILDHIISYITLLNKYCQYCLCTAENLCVCVQVQKHFNPIIWKVNVELMRFVLFIIISILYSSNMF